MIKKKVRGQNCPWLTNEIKQMMRERDSYLKKARRTNAEVHWSSYRRSRNRVVNKIKFEKGRYSKEILENNLDDPKAFWKTVKGIFPSKKSMSGPPQSLKINDELITGRVQIAEKLNEFFTTTVGKLIAALKRTGHGFSCHELFTDKKMKFRSVSKTFVLRQLRSLKVKKATGLDRIPARLLKDAAPIILESVTYLVNRSIETSTVPDEWKAAKVVALHKSGARDNPDNYRPISILPVLSKIIEKAVCVQLQAYLQENCLLSPFQSGFRKNHSTQAAVTYFCDNIYRSMDSGKLTGALFIDLRKAFDTVSHERLISKLSRYGIRDQELSWFRNYLKNRTQIVSIQHDYSSPLGIDTGVPQGSILGPILFIMYIDDLHSCLQFTKFMMYADDTVLYYSAPLLPEIEMKLNLDLINLSTWLQNNELILNMDKTEVVIFGTGQRLAKQDYDDFQVLFEGQVIQQSKVFKYLGVILDDRLSFNEHVLYIESKVSRVLGVFSRLRYLLTAETANRLYKAMVLPILDYCDTVWHGGGKTNSIKIERLQRRAGRIVYVNSSMCTDEIISNLGWELLSERRKQHIFNQVSDCLAGKAPTYFQNYFNQRRSDIHCYSTRICGNLNVEKTKLEITKNSFFVKGALIYNSNDTI